MSVKGRAHPLGTTTRDSQSNVISKRNVKKATDSTYTKALSTRSWNLTVDGNKVQDIRNITSSFTVAKQIHYIHNMSPICRLV